LEKAKVRANGPLLVYVLMASATGCVLDMEDSVDDIGAVQHGLCSRTPLPGSRGLSWHWGGGYGYPEIVNPGSSSCANVQVVLQQATNQATKSLLMARVANATAGTVIYLDNAVKIDMGTDTLVIDASDVWLASSRGRIVNGSAQTGALIRSSDTATKNPIIRVTGSDVRITGLRIWGNEPEQCPVQWENPSTCTLWRPCSVECPTDPDNCPVNCLSDSDIATGNCHNCTPAKAAVSTIADSLEIDNCDIGGVPGSGVQVVGAQDVYIHHNYIHHVQRVGLGYPVVIGGEFTPANAIIEGNRFQYYRHAVASEGYRDHDYLAWYNLAMDKTIGRVFDIHGENQTHEGGGQHAGGRTLVYYNVITPGYYFSLDVRGRPQEGVWFHSNCTTRASGLDITCTSPSFPDDDGDGTAICQRRYFGNVWLNKDSIPTADTNTYVSSPFECEGVPARWCMASAGLSPWRYLNQTQYGQNDDVRFANFDGDTKADVFRATGSEWRVSYDGTSLWQIVKNDTTPLSGLLFADFDGDGTTDVFRSKDGRWEYVKGEPPPSSGSDRWDGTWHLLRNDRLPVTGLRTGKFEGSDNKADVFRAQGGRWEFRKNGTNTTWTFLRSSNLTVADLGFGQFDNDGAGYTDIFAADGNDWRYYAAGITGVVLSAPNGIRAYKLKFADVTGDGKTDVFYANGRLWRYQSGGTGPWIELAIASESYTDIELANFDDDPRADVFYPGCI
jgi:hypothetical protein